MLSIIILGLESIIGDKINVYLMPLVEKLKELWEIGVHVRMVPHLMMKQSLIFKLSYFRQFMTFQHMVQL